MSARAESLAKQFEAKAAEMTAVITKLSDADWKKITAAEKWPWGSPRIISRAGTRRFWAS